VTTNAELLARYRAVLPGFLNPLHSNPIAIDRGEGSYVFDLDGGRYLDWFGGVLTTMIGHNNPAVVAAVTEQASKVMHTSTLYLSEPMISLAEEIARLSGIADARVFFTTSGTEANETALMLATNHRGSNEILALRNSYHGRSFSTLAVTGNRHWAASSLSGLNVSFVQNGYRMRSPFGSELNDDDYTDACVADLSQVIDMTTTGRVAAMIAEPIQGVGGFVTPPDGFFGAMKKVLDNNDILFISDEVQTGWGRTGDHFWGYEAHGIVPDMITFAKGVGNGASLAGVVASAEIMDSMTATTFSTFGGNPMVTAAGLATVGEVVSKNLQGNAKAQGTRLRAALDAAGASTPWIAEVRGRGLMQAIEICHDNSLEADPAKTAAFLDACKDEGLLLGKGGIYGNVIRIAPMLNVTDAELDEGITAITRAIASL
jgi:4-aminobutyrate aminotransferase